MWLVTFCILFFVYCIYDCWKPKDYPPGPVWLPFVGCYPMFHWLHSRYKRNYLVFDEWARVYGPVLGVKLGNENIVIISTHDLAKKAMLQNEFNGRPDGFFPRLRSFGTLKGVVFTEGTKWSECRRFTMKCLRKFRGSQLSTKSQLTVEARSLVKHFQKLSENGAVRMDNAFNIAVINCLWYSFAGHRFEYDDKKVHEMLETVNESFRLINTMGGLINQMPFLRFIIPELSGYNPLVRILSRLWKFLEEEIVAHEEKLSYDEPRDLIDAFLIEIRSNAEKEDTIFDRENLLMVCLDLFMAGSNTTSDTLTTIFLLLSLYDEYIEILQAELDRVVGRSRAPTEEDLPFLPMMEAFLAEVQRYYLLAPLGIPHKTTNDVFMNGYKIPKNTSVFFNFHSIQNDETYFDRPDQFRPQRFLDEQGRFRQNNASLPFGSGKRRCIGETLARSTLFLFVSHVLHYFNVELSSSHEKPKWDFHDGFTLCPNPYYLKLSTRSDFSKVFEES